MFRRRKGDASVKATPAGAANPPLLARTGRFRLVVVIVHLCFVAVAVKLWPYTLRKRM